MCCLNLIVCLAQQGKSEKILKENLRNRNAFSMSQSFKNIRQLIAGIFNIMFSKLLLVFMVSI